MFVRWISEADALASLLSRWRVLSISWRVQTLMEWVQEVSHLKFRDEDADS